MKLIDNLIKQVKVHSPEILVGVGISGVVAGTVLACKETRNIDPIIEDHKETIKQIHMASDMGIMVDEETNESVEYTEKDKRKDLTLTYFKTGLELTKLYLPSGIVICGSLVCILQSHRILNKRNLGLTAAYTGLSSVFEEYRKNIIEKYGEEADAEARYSIKAKKAKGKDGKEDITYQETDETGKNEKDHSRFFDEGSKFWNKSPNLNLMAIHSAEINLNRKLKYNRDHKISLNECYYELDLPPAQDGRVLGYEFKPGIDPVDINGIPMVVKIPIYTMNRNGKRTLKSVDEIINTDYEEATMLLDFPNLITII